MNQSVYLDNAATTRVSDEACRIMQKVFAEDYGNPSSKHIKGMEAERHIKEAADIIAASLKVNAKEIVFTSGGTEANNMALIGTALANRRAGMHIITSGFEHASVYNPLLTLEEFGFKIDFAPVDEFGHIKLAELLELIHDDTILVSLMYVNNEIGAVQNIAEISAAIKAKKKDIIFHVDAIQAYAKYRIYPKREGIDLLSASAHKFHGPKGAGFLYIADKVKVKPIIYGGGQQKDRRSGTENVPAIAGMGAAVSEAYENHDEKKKHLYALKRHFIERLGELSDVVINGLEGIDRLEETAPHIVSVGFKGIKSEVLLHALEDKGIYVSSGSACSSNHPGISGTLKAIGAERELLDSTLRFSFCFGTDIGEIDYAIETLKELLPVLRRFRKR